MADARKAIRKILVESRKIDEARFSVGYPETSKKFGRRGVGSYTKIGPRLDNARKKIAKKGAPQKSWDYLFKVIETVDKMMSDRGYAPRALYANVRWAKAIRIYKDRGAERAHEYVAVSFAPTKKEIQPPGDDLEYAEVYTGTDRADLEAQLDLITGNVEDWGEEEATRFAKDEPKTQGRRRRVGGREQPTRKVGPDVQPSRDIVSRPAPRRIARGRTGRRVD